MGFDPEAKKLEIGLQLNTDEKLKIFLEAINGDDDGKGTLALLNDPDFILSLKLY